VLGTSVGNYTVTAKIGEGGMGTVYLAEHATLGRRAAVKVLLPLLSNHRDTVARFFNEARAATAIRHPGIVEIFDFGYLPSGSAYIVMEFLDGESLAARRARLGRLEPVRAVALVRQIAGALAAAHERSIVSAANVPAEAPPAPAATPSARVEEAVKPAAEAAPVPAKPVEPAYVHLQIDSAPAGADVTLDGKRIGATPLHDLARL
jgi:hypothetical protein